jgi:hypothetical protein
MSWLAPGASDVRALQQPTYALWLRTLEETRRLVEPRFLHLLRRRTIDAYGGEVADDAGDPTDLERDMLAYAEQLMIDQNRIEDDLEARLAARLSPEELAGLAFTAYTHDADLRARALLEVEPSASVEDAASETGGGEGEPFPFPLVSPAYGEALGRFGMDACRRSTVDDVTSEVCRLRNALHQQCRF